MGTKKKERAFDCLLVVYNVRENKEEYEDERKQIKKYRGTIARVIVTTSITVTTDTSSHVVSTIRRTWSLWVRFATQP